MGTIPVLNSLYGSCVCRSCDQASADYEQRVCSCGRANSIERNGVAMLTPLLVLNQLIHDPSTGYWGYRILGAALQHLDAQVGGPAPFWTSSEHCFAHGVEQPPVNAEALPWPLPSARKAAA